MIKIMEAYKYEVVRLLNVMNNGNLFGDCPEPIRKVDEACCWAWDNWDDEIISTYYEGEKPKYPTENFIYQWVENGDFEADGFNVEALKEL